MNILVVDHHPSNRKLLRVQLEAEGFQVVEAADGVEGLEVLARETIAAVISDILMPRMDGYRFCHEVRRDPRLRSMRFILYSSTYTAPEDVLLSHTVGADVFIAKPAPVAVILEALRNSPAAGTAHTSELPDDAIVLSQYSSVLVAKLEEKNTELQAALDMARTAHDEIQEWHATLERKVSLRSRARRADADCAPSRRDATGALC